jgi:hypothetical protein
MATCQICKREFRSLRFDTEDISICVRCVNTLNGSPEPASHAIDRLAEMLARGMHRNIERDLLSDDGLVKERAQRRRANFDQEHAAALPGWINKLLKDSSNSTRDFKIARAYRRGMLRMEPSRQWDYPSDWAERASRIRRRDRICQLCGTADKSLDVHHIVYLSNYGTNQQTNLVALCRSCHENVHDRSFDLGETDYSGLRRKESASQVTQTSSPVVSTSPTVSLHLSKNLICPGCRARVTAKILASDLRTQQVRCPGCKLVFVAAEHLATEQTQQNDSRSLGSSAFADSQLGSATRLSALTEATGAESQRLLRAVRAAIGLLAIALLVTFLGALPIVSDHQAVGVIQSNNASHFALLILVSEILLLATFHILRGLINRRHAAGSRYRRPLLRKPWSI